MARTCVLLALLFTSTLSRYIPLFDDSESTEAIVASLSAPNHHGAPFPPGSFGSSAGWYYGDDPSSTLVDGLPWLKDKVYQHPDIFTTHFIVWYVCLYRTCARSSSKVLTLSNAPSLKQNRPKPMVDDQLTQPTLRLPLQQLLHRHIPRCSQTLMHPSRAPAI